MTFFVSRKFFTDPKPYDISTSGRKKNETNEVHFNKKLLVKTNFTN